MIKENPKYYEDAYKVLENLDKKHHNFLAYTFAMKSVSERIEYVNKMVDEFGLEKWNELSQKYHLGHFLKEIEE